MRPSKLFLWLLLGCVLMAPLIFSVSPIAPEWSLLPLGALILLFVLDWFVSFRPAHFQTSEEARAEVFVGETVPLTITLRKKQVLKKLAANMAAQISASDGFEFLGHKLVSDTQSDAKMVLTLRAKKRGTWLINRYWLHWVSRLRLIEFIPSYQASLNFNVVPNIRPATSGQVDLHLRTSEFGIKQTQFSGEGSEFHQLNEYVAGMDPRSIDWKHSARHHKLVAKEMRAERNHHIILALDNGHLMREEVDGLPKIDHQINAALALGWAALRSGDLVGLFAFDAQPRLFVPPNAAANTFSQLRRHTGEMSYNSAETNHTLAMTHLRQRIQKRSLVVIFSDFVDPLTAQLLLDHVAILNRQHVIIFVSLRDPVLEKIASNDAASANLDDIAEIVTATNLLEERRAVLETMSSLGVYVIEAGHSQITPRLINTYLRLKAQEVV